MTSTGSTITSAGRADSAPAARAGGPSGLGAALLCALVLCGTAVAALPLKYEVNDDFGMVLSLAGGDGFAPSAETQFISRVLSQSLFFLYERIPGVPWYGVLLFCGMTLGLTLFLSTWIAVPTDRIVKWLVLVAWLPTLGHWIYATTFTAATLMLELGAFLRLLAWLAAGRCFPLRGWFLTFCLAFAYLWRAPLAIYSVVLAAPLLLYLRAQDCKQLLPYIVVLAALVGVDQTWDRWATTTADDEYSEYSRLRAQFQDRPAGRVGPNTARAVDAAGWTDDDHELVRTRWFLYDERLVNPTTLRAFLEANRAATVSPWTSGRQALSTAWGATRNFMPVVFCVGLSVIWLRYPTLFGPAPAVRWRNVLAMFLILTPVVGLVFYRFVARVALPVLAFALGALLVLEPQAPEHPPTSPVALGMRLRRAATWLGLAVSLACSLNAIRADLSTLRTDYLRKQFVQSSVRDLLAATPTRPLLVLLDPRYGLSHETIHPLRELRDLSGYRVLPAGTAIRSPRYASILSSLGLASGSQFLDWLIDNEGVVFVLFTPADLEGERESEETVRLWESYFNRRVISPTGRTAPVQLEPLKHTTGSRGERMTFFHLVSNPRRTTPPDAPVN